MIWIAGNKLEKIKIALQSQFKNFSVETQISSFLEFVVCIVYIGITKLGDNAR